MPPLSSASFSNLNKLKVVFFDFDGVFTTNHVHIDAKGNEYVTCNRYDGFGLSALMSKGIKPIVLSTEVVPLATVRCDKLGIESHVGVKDKCILAEKILIDNRLSFSNACFLGNDINDLSLLLRVSLPVITSDAHTSLHKNSFYITEKMGGDGCVRELCDFLVA